MKNLLQDIYRKTSLAGELVQNGEWSEFFHKTRRNLNRALAPLTEAYTIGQDAVVHSYWRQRKHDNWSTPFRAGSLSNTHPKNVIWIMPDALRHDILHEYVRRGGFADLVDSGAYFSNTFAQGSWTYPSVFSFLTGQYPFNCGVSNIVSENGVPVSVCADFDDTCPTIFSILRQQGYQVASILDGWGFTVRDTAGQAHREDHYFERNWGWIYGQDRRFLSLDELRDASVSYVERAAGTAPFMLFVRSLYTHSPYRDIFDSPEYVTSLSRRGWNFRIVEGFMRGLARFEAMYMQPLLETLAQTRQLDNTIIVFCSDHGEMFWNLEEDLRTDEAVTAIAVPDEEIWRHQLEPYNALIKVPLIISGSGLRGTYTDRFRLVDVVPTLLEELGVTHNPAEFDGVSVRTPASRPIYADSAGYGNGGIAFQGKGQKLLMSHRLGAVSYNLTSNEYERLEARRDAGTAVEEFSSFFQEANRRTLSGLDEADEDVLLRRLQALGYVD